jgi:hypothetical protein
MAPNVHFLILILSILIFSDIHVAHEYSKLE